ncbi:MAG: cytochrome P450 [Actinobacteria bacterium]|nr:cytochrome P450 [Actinomycetota bacterium]
MSQESFDPFLPGHANSAWPLLKSLREQTPVAPIARGMFYVTRYDEARAVLRDVEHFSSAAGFRAPGVEVPEEDRVLGEQDPPQHPFIRRLVLSAFNVAAVRKQEPFIRDQARALLEAIPNSATVDLVEAFTVPLPNLATVHLLGFPLGDAKRIASWSREVMDSEWPAMNRTERGVGFDGAFPEFTAYIDDHIAHLRSAESIGEGGESLLVQLMKAELDGQALSDRQLRALVHNLLIGGITTTSQLLGNAAYELLSSEELACQIREDPSKIPQMLEESMRLAPPVMFIPRGCVKQVEIGGVLIPAGAKVIVGTASANRDERVFAEADEFVVPREGAERHLTFGFGPHLCLGAHLARTVGRIGIEELLGRFPQGSIELASGYVFEKVASFFEHGPRSLEVVTTL